MPFNPNNDKQRSRFVDAMMRARRMLEPFRRNRKELIEQYVGAHWSDDAARDRVPINLLELAANIYTQHLVSDDPRTIIVPKHNPNLRPYAKSLELSTNKLIGEVNLRDTLASAVLDALFSVGIVKVGVTLTGQVNINGEMHAVGQPFADVVDIDDWVHDVTARRWSEIGYAGNRYRVPKESLENDDMYNQKIVKQLMSGLRDTTMDGGVERTEEIGNPEHFDSQDFRDMVELWDIWFPMERLVVTFDAAGAHRPLRTVEWDGPERGPYHRLGFEDVPQHVMPLAPGATWRDLAELVNVLMRKLGRQAERQKTFYTVSQGAEEDADRISGVNDGQGVRLDAPPGSVEERSMGGINQSNMAFLMFARGMFAYLGGNLDVLGGLGPQSETFGQDRLLAASASRRVEKMQARTVKFTSDIIQDLAFYRWSDPLQETHVTKQVQGTDIQIPVVLTPQNKVGDFLEYNFSVEPFSMQHFSPAEKSQRIMGILQGFVLPILPLLQEQGMTIRFGEVLDMLSEYNNLPELKGLIEFSQIPLGQQVAGQFTPKQSPVTQRTNVRVNRSGATRDGQEKTMMQLLMGGGVQDDELAALARVVG